MFLYIGYEEFFLCVNFREIFVILFRNQKKQNAYEMLDLSQRN